MRLNIRCFSLVLFLCTAIFGYTTLAYGQTYETYENNLYGFQFDYYNYAIDDSMEEIKTTFFNRDTIIEIYYDNFNDAINKANSYIYYGNTSIKNGEYINILENRLIEQNGLDIYVHKWKRKPLKHIENDYNNYVNLDIVNDNNEVYTIFVRSLNEIDCIDLINRFGIIEKDTNAVLKSITFKNNKNKKLLTGAVRSFYEDNIVNASKQNWGIFEPSTKKGLDELQKLESALDYKFPYVLQYYDLNGQFNRKNITEIYKQDRCLELTFQTSLYGRPNENSLLEMLDGKYDSIIDKLIDEIKTVEKPVLFRLNNEMNGDWCEYNALHYQKDTSLYRSLWKYMYDKFQEKGVENAIWVWNPNGGDFPGYKWNHFLNYFPGEEYVDIIGVTGYNTGNYYKGEVWREFDEIYDGIMLENKKYFTGYPYIITEFGSSVFGGNKQEWLDKMFKTLKNYDIKIAIWWNSIDYDHNGNPARIYKFDNDLRTLHLFKQGIARFR